MYDIIGNIDMDLLDGANYFTWKFRMKHILVAANLHKAIQHKDPPRDINPRTWQGLNLNAVATIRQYLHPKVLGCVSNETNAYVLWEKLKDMYELKNTAMNKVLLMRKLMGLKYKEGECMGDHIGDFLLLVSQLAELGVSLDDEVQAVMLLSTVPLGTLDVICLDNLGSDGKLTLTEVQAYLINKEATRKLREEMEASRDKSKGRLRSKSGSKSRGKVVCYYCNKPGHIQKFCWEKKRDKSSSF